MKRIICKKGNSSWEESLNFVDENNVVLGYDFSAQCCEDFGYHYEDASGATVDVADDELEPFRFDTEYFASNRAEGELPADVGEFDLWARFRIVSPERELFIVLTNAHNGYYGHGFELSADDRVLREGGL